MASQMDNYRRAQRLLRAAFDDFTRSNCAACPTPCCVRPARIQPSDIAIAEACGWAPPSALGSGTDAAAAVAMDTAGALADDAGQLAGTPCHFLGATGCTFPDDLRPYGCAAYICRYMYAKLDRRSLARLRRLVRDLDRHHIELQRVIRLPADRQTRP